MGRPRSSKRRSVREESRAVYRRAITEAAMRVFGQLGFGEAKMADIAAEAGVATGTLYNYFTSKEEIFQSILDDGRERVTAELADKARIEDPMVRLREIIGGMLDFLEEHGVLFAIYVQLYANPSQVQRSADKDEAAFRRAFFDILSATIREAGDRIRPDLPPDDLAWALGGLMNGAIVEWVENGCKPGLRRHTELIMDLFFHGATPR